MKKLLVFLMGFGLVSGALAQGGHRAGGGYHYHRGGYAVYPRVSFGVGFYSPLYNPYGYFGYNPYWGFPYGGYTKPTKLESQVEDIKSDYEDRIYSVRHDSSLTGKERRQTVHSLKKQRDQEIHDLVANYHRQPDMQ